MKSLKLLTLILVLSIFAGCGATTTSTSTTDQNRDISTTNEEPKEWVEIASWSGSGMKTTETFVITSDEFRIKWKTMNEAFENSGIFQIYVNDESGQMVSLAGNKQGPGSDVSYVKEGPGRYYLEINSANIDWDVSVEEQQ